MTIKLVLAAAALSVSAITASAQPAALPGNIDCSQMTKRPNGNWYIAGPARIDVGGAHNTYMDTEIGPRDIPLGDVDLYDFIDQKCGGK